MMNRLPVSILKTSRVFQFSITSSFSARTYAVCCNTKIHRLCQPKQAVHNVESKRNFSLDQWFEWQMGLFRSLSESALVTKCQQCLIAAHEMSGLPWWATVIATTFAVRLFLTFPIKIYQAKVLARYENLAPEIQELAKELRRETVIAVKQFAWDNKYAALMYNKSCVNEAKPYIECSLKKHVNDLIARDNCHPTKGTISVWIQIPVWVSMSVAWRNLAYGFPLSSVESKALMMSLSYGGAMWFPNLVDVDHSFVLPVAFGLINLVILEVETGGKKAKTTVQKVAKGIARATAIFMVPIAASMPACVSLYWTVSSLSALIQNSVIKLPKVRRAFKIPQTPSESATPFKDVWNNHFSAPSEKR